MELIKSMERLEQSKTTDIHKKTDLPSAIGHPFGTRGCTYSRKKLILIFLCVLSFFFMYFSNVCKWTSIWIWLDVIRHPNITAKERGLRVCSDHFEGTDYPGDRLKPGAVCTVFPSLVEPLKEKSEITHKDTTVDEVTFSTSTSFTSFNDSSSAQNSVVRLEQPRAQYCVGDTLNVLVEITDYEGNLKAHGGDFILARIHSPKLKACASGNVTDLLNGSYRVHFHLFWPGEVQVSVLLIHSSEAVKVLQKDWIKNYSKVTHMGTFVIGRKKETSECALRLSSDTPLCEYRKKQDGEYYACYKPHTLPCNSLTTMRSYAYHGPNFTKEELQLLAQENTGIAIPNSFNPVTVVGCTGTVHRPTEKCVVGMNSHFPGGYFYSDRWSSSSCQAGPFLNAGAITRCLKEKTLYLLGDSTARQWIEYLNRKLKGLRMKGSRLLSYLAVDARNKITVRWIKHAHPWLSTLPSSIKKSVTIPEVLDSITLGRGQKDVIVVIGIGQHFRPYPPEVFIRRLQSIRRAILRLHTRIPQAVVVIKLENTIKLRPNMIGNSNWYGYMQNLAQRKVFEHLKVALVDAWDMTVAANTSDVHPNPVIVSNQVALALSYSCH